MFKIFMAQKMNVPFQIEMNLNLPSLCTVSSKGSRFDSLKRPSLVLESFLMIFHVTRIISYETLLHTSSVGDVGDRKGKDSHSCAVWRFSQEIESNESVFLLSQYIDSTTVINNQNHLHNKFWILDFRASSHLVVAVLCIFLDFFRILNLCFHTTLTLLEGRQI
jgi:hypothetical protein